MSYDDLGDRMKRYESVETGRRFIDYLPVYARIDGRSFSRLTKDLDKPHDNDMWQIMNEVTKYLVHQTQALIGYHQSDEISLCWLQKDIHSQMFFDGKIFKMHSVLASMATSKFMHSLVLRNKPEKWSKKFNVVPHFDARVFQLPNLDELANAFLWRCLDCERNAIQGLGQSNFSHKELQGKSCKNIKSMLQDKGIVMSIWPDHFFYGTFVVRDERIVNNIILQDSFLRVTNRKEFIARIDKVPMYDII